MNPKLKFNVASSSAAAAAAAGTRFAYEDICRQPMGFITTIMRSDFRGVMASYVLTEALTYAPLKLPHLDRGFGLGYELNGIHNYASSNRGLTGTTEIYLFYFVFPEILIFFDKS